MEKRLEFREWFLVGLVALASVSANLPDSVIARLGVHREYLLYALSLTVAIALLHYLKFTFFLVVVVMAVGANLQEDLAVALGISQVALVMVLLVMVVISFVNYAFHFLPSGIDAAPTIRSAEGARAMEQALAKGGMKRVERLVSLGVDVNVGLRDGNTPLILAVESGNLELVNYLLDQGADPMRRNAEGKNAQDVAVQRDAMDIVKAICHAQEQRAKVAAG